MISSHPFGEHHRLHLYLDINTGHTKSRKILLLIWTSYSQIAAGRRISLLPKPDSLFGLGSALDAVNTVTPVIVGEWLYSFVNTYLTKSSSFRLRTRIHNHPSPGRNRPFYLHASGRSEMKNSRYSLLRDFHQIVKAIARVRIWYFKIRLNLIWNWIRNYRDLHLIYSWGFDYST